MMRILLLTVVVIVVGACTPHLPLRDFLYYFPQHAYAINPTQMTPKGIRVDAGGPINLKRIDRVVDAVEACVTKTFGTPPKLPDVYKSATGASCVGLTFPLPFERSKFVIKIARDWKLSDDGTQQLLPLDAGHGCEAKGQKPPCMWRAIIVDEPLTIVVPPSMYLLPDDLLRLNLGCLNPWFEQAMAVCAMPQTGALDDGTGD